MMYHRDGSHTYKRKAPAITKGKHSVEASQRHIQGVPYVWEYKSRTHQRPNPETMHYVCLAMYVYAPWLRSIELTAQDPRAHTASSRVRFPVAASEGAASGVAGGGAAAAANAHELLEVVDGLEHLTANTPCCQCADLAPCQTPIARAQARKSLLA